MPPRSRFTFWPPKELTDPRDRREEPNRTPNLTSATRGSREPRAIKQLRCKLGENPARPRWILNDRDVGYRAVPGRIARVSHAPPRRTAARPFRIGSLEIDRSKRRVMLARRPVRLTATEFRLLHALPLDTGGATTCEVFQGRVWGPAAVSGPVCMAFDRRE